MLPTRPPLDLFPYPRHPESRPFGPDLGPGLYVFVQDETGDVHVVLETEGHLHPRILGGAQPVAAAGGLKLSPGGVILEVDNFSGTFQFGPEIFPLVLEALARQGGQIMPGCEKPFAY